MSVGTCVRGKKLYVLYANSGTVFKVSTGIKITPAKWDKDAKKPIQGKLKPAEELLLDSYSMELSSAVLRVRSSGIYPSCEAVRKEYYAGKAKKDPRQEKQKNMPEEFLEYLSSRKSQVSFNHMRNMRAAYRVLKDFILFRKKSFPPDKFTQKLAEEFINYLIEVRNLQDASVEKHVTVIKAFFKRTHPEMNLRFFSVKVKKKNIIALTTNELSILKSLENLPAHLERTRDLFLFMCYTGMRHSDTLEMCPDWVEKKTISFNQVKTKGLAVTFIHPVTAELLKKYDNNCPKLNQQVFNRHLKVLFRRAGLGRQVKVIQFHGGQMQQSYQPLHKIIKSHIARKTFITIALSKGIAIQDVMKMSGHSDFRSMTPYIFISKEHIENAGKIWDS